MSVSRMLRSRCRTRSFRIGKGQRSNSQLEIKAPYLYAKHTTWDTCKITPETAGKQRRYHNTENSKDKDFLFYLLFYAFIYFQEKQGVLLVFATEEGAKNNLGPRICFNCETPLLRTTHVYSTGINKKSQNGKKS